MNVRVLIAALIGAVVSFFLGWLVFVYVVTDFYAAHSLHYAGLEKMPPNLIGIFVAGFANALLIAVIFNKWANINTLAAGAIAGTWISFLIILSIDLYLWSSLNLMGKRVVIADILINTLIGTIVGTIIAWVLGYKKDQ
ncbi:MAG: hypothetical protein U0T69_04415 [Chitinophagales bacterium]